MAFSTQEKCPCVGSMGLHQNNIGSQNPTNLSKVGFQFAQLSNRSVIDVFRGLRDRYFGRNEPESTSKGILEEQRETDQDEDQASINSLPACCKLLILSLLDTCDICRVSCVSSHWRDVANDQILWRELLIRDMCKWDSLTNKSHPLIPQFWRKDHENGFGVSLILPEQNHHTPGAIVGELMSASPSENADVDPKEKQDIHANTGINYKALYIHSSYQRWQDDTEGTTSPRIPEFIMSFLTSGVEEQGEVIMTGPGMDSPRTSLIFRSLMWGSGFMETKGLLPGNRDGIGSGVLVLFREKITFKLIALYSGNNRVRERRFGMARLLESNMVEAVPHPSNVGEQEPPTGDNQGENLPAFDFVLHEAVHQYFADRTPGYKLVYLVDSTASLNWEDLSCNRLELQAILRGTEVVGDPENLTQEATQNETSDDDASPTPNSTHKNSGCFKRPLLVLSCVASPDVKRVPCVQITAMLNLPAVIDRAWRVQDVTVSTMEGVEKGLEWLLKQP